MGTQVLDLMAQQVLSLETTSLSQKSSSTLLKYKEIRTAVTNMAFDL